MTEKYLTRREASEYLKAKGLPVAASTMGKFATTGGGPEYQIWGRGAFYTESALDAWALGRLGKARTSTSHQDI
jgi:hypothetical protein